jgi:hypothetical protein
MQFLDIKTQRIRVILFSIFLILLTLLAVTLSSKKVSAVNSSVTITKFSADPADDLSDNKATVNIELTASSLNFKSGTIVLIIKTDTNTSVFEQMQPLNFTSSEFVGNKLQLTQEVPTLYNGKNIISCVWATTEFAGTCAEMGMPNIQITKSTAQIPVYRFFNNKLGTHLYTSNINEKSTLQTSNSNDPKLEWSYEGYKYFVFNDMVSYPKAVPVYRLFNTKEGGHIYTISEEEKTNILANLSKYSYEGIKYYVLSSSEDGFIPVYRFFNTKTGTHLYTISESEKSTIMTTLPQYKFEGEKYYVLAN